MLLTRLSRRCFSLHKSVKPTIDIESQTIVDPGAYEDRNLFSRLQNWLSNKNCLSDMQRSLKDVKMKHLNSRFLHQYNQVVRAIDNKDYQFLEDALSPTLFKTFKKTLRKNEQLPYFLEKASACELVQARAYTQNITLVKSTNKWFQLTFKYTLPSGEEAHHVLERNDKVKNFNFIKFHL